MSKFEIKREKILYAGYAPGWNGSHRSTKEAVEKLNRGRLSKCEERSERRRQKEQEVFPSSGSIGFNPPSV